MAKVRRISGQIQMTLAHDTRAGVYRVRLCATRVGARSRVPCETVRVKIAPVPSNDPQFEYDRAARAALRVARPDLVDFAHPTAEVTRPRRLPRPRSYR